MPQTEKFLTYFELALRAVGINVGDHGAKLINEVHKGVTTASGKWTIKDAAELKAKLDEEFKKEE